MKKTIPRPPAHLTDETRAWWRAVVKEYVLEGHHLRLLEAACVSWDRLTQAREILAKDGLVVAGREGPKAHPMLAIERDNKTSFARLVRELDLDVDAPASGARPPALRSNRRGGYAG